MRLPAHDTLNRAALLRLSLLPATLLTLPRTAPAAGDMLSSGSSPTGAYQPSLQGKDYGKSEMSYADFKKGNNGLLYKDAKLGVGKTPSKGDRVVVDWTGYTIGYFGRPFETKQLKSLDGKDDVFLRFVLGSGTVIPGIDQGVLGMSEGGIRQIVVPPSVGYPESDPSHEAVGPRPSTFSGQRALDFVLQNRELIDKTLLFNVKLIRVDPAGSFKG